MKAARSRKTSGIFSRGPLSGEKDAHMHMMAFVFQPVQNQHVAHCLFLLAQNDSSDGCPHFLLNALCNKFHDQEGSPLSTYFRVVFYILIYNIPCAILSPHISSSTHLYPCLDQVNSSFNVQACRARQLQRTVHGSIPNTVLYYIVAAKHMHRLSPFPNRDL